MSSTEQIYALLVAANPVPDPEASRQRIRVPCASCALRLAIEPAHAGRCFMSSAWLPSRMVRRPLGCR